MIAILYPARVLHNIISRPTSQKVGSACGVSFSMCTVLRKNEIYNCNTISRIRYRLINIMEKYVHTTPPNSNKERPIVDIAVYYVFHSPSLNIGELPKLLLGISMLLANP